MPNAVRPLKRTDRLTKRQKTLVERIKRQQLQPVVYRRKGNSNKISVHNPFLDIVRKSKKPENRKYPHASDSDRQRRLLSTKSSRKIAKQQSKRKDPIKKALKGLFFP
jgi:hypothetical protein